MVALPWRSFGPPEPDREYATLLTYLPLRRARRLPAFVRFTRGIQRQLADRSEFGTDTYQVGL